MTATTAPEVKPEPLPQYSGTPRALRVFRWRVYRLGRRAPALVDGSLPLLLFAQLVALLWLGYQHQTGGYNAAQYQTTAWLIGAGGLAFLLATALSFRLRIRKRFVPAYTLLLLFLVRAKPAGNCSFELMIAALLLLEAVAVVYLLRHRFLNAARIG